jgi:hypothetical protein
LISLSPTRCLSLTLALCAVSSLYTYSRQVLVFSDSVSAQSPPSSLHPTPDPPTSPTLPLTPLQPFAPFPFSESLATGRGAASARGTGSTRAPRCPAPPGRERERIRRVWASLQYMGGGGWMRRGHLAAGAAVVPGGGDGGLDPRPAGQYESESGTMHCHADTRYASLTALNPPTPLIWYALDGGLDPRPARRRHSATAPPNPQPRDIAVEGRVITRERETEQGEGKRERGSGRESEREGEGDGEEREGGGRAR